MSGGGGGGGGVGVWFFGKGANNADVRGVVRGQKDKEVNVREGEFNRLVLQPQKNLRKLGKLIEVKYLFRFPLELVSIAVFRFIVHS